MRVAGWVLLTLLTAVATATAWTVPFLGWVRGDVTYRQAIWLAFPAMLAGCWLAGYVGQLARRRYAAPDLGP